MCHTPARSLLTVGGNTRVALDFFPRGCAERSLFQKTGLREGMARLRESKLIAFTRFAQTTPALDA